VPVILFLDMPIRIAEDMLVLVEVSALEVDLAAGDTAASIMHPVFPDGIDTMQAIPLRSE
jgi:hypothetical protein